MPVPETSAIDVTTYAQAPESSETTLSAYPDEDHPILGALLEAGADLSEPRQVLHYLYVGSRDDQVEAGSAMRSLGWDVEEPEPLREYPDDWLVRVHRTDVVLMPEFVWATRSALEGLAERLDGEYDGWEAAVGLVPRYTPGDPCPTCAHLLMPLDREQTIESLERQRAFYESRVQEQDANYPGYGAKWNAFCEIVLRHDGALVVPPMQPDLMMTLIGDHGSVIPDSVRIVCRPGARSECHANAVALWRRGEAIAIGTGFALSDDSLWREHSWAWSEMGELIETTEQRVRYFGLRFEGEGAELFAQWVTPHNKNT